VLNTLPVVVRLSVIVQFLKRHELIEAEVKQRITEHKGKVLVPSVLEAPCQSVSNERGIVEAEGKCGLRVL
jgi:hypothetical protein